MRRCLWCIGTVAGGGEKVQVATSGVIIYVDHDIRLAWQQAQDGSLLGRTAQDDNHFVDLLAYVVDHHAALRHSVHKVAVDEDRECLAMSRLEADVEMLRCNRAFLRHRTNPHGANQRRQ